MTPKPFFVSFTIFEKTSTVSFLIIFLIADDEGGAKEGPEEEKKKYIRKSQFLYCQSGSDTLAGHRRDMPRKRRKAPTANELPAHQLQEFAGAI